MRIKYYLRGLGVGIIVATIILSISSALRQPEMSDKEIMERAAELGMVMPEEESNLIIEEPEESEEAEADAAEATTETATEESTDDTAEQTDTAAAAEESDAKTEEAAREEIESTADETATASDTTSQSTDTVVEKKAFTISKGQDSATISNNLYKAGLIDSAVAFDEYMSKCHVDSLLQEGTFYLTTDMDYDDIVAVLVTKQDDRQTNLQ